VINVIVNIKIGVINFYLSYILNPGLQPWINIIDNHIMFNTNTFTMDS